MQQFVRDPAPDDSFKGYFSSLGRTLNASN